MNSLTKLFIISFSCFLPVAAQQSSPLAQASGPSATDLLSKSLAALTGGHPLTDVTLSGTARRIAGSDDESGTNVAKALATGEARMDLSFPSGSRSEVVAVSNKCPAGSWSGPDGVAHSISNHNLMTDSSWFFPTFTIGRLLSPGPYTLTLVGQETRNGQTVEHVMAYQSSTVQLPFGIPTFSHLTQMDLFLDSNTLLPAALAFNTHPDKDAGLDIPVEIRFSDYRSVNGAQIPFHVQKFINNSLSLDFQFDSAVLNSGLSTSSFTVGAGL
jgi:hypothetical protein